MSSAMNWRTSAGPSGGMGHRVKPGRDDKKESYDKSIAETPPSTNRLAP